MDVKTEFAKWDDIEEMIKRGEHPSPIIIAEKLRANRRLPKYMRDYLAGLIDGSIQRPRGRPTLAPFEALTIKRGKHPSPGVVVEKLRGDRRLPPTIRNYLAD